MRISYLTLFPDFYKEFKATSIIKKAIDKGIVEIKEYDLRDYVKKGRVDSKIVSGGKGNLLRYDVVSDALKDLSNPDTKTILVTPRGQVFNQRLASELAKEKDLVFICPHFEGIDARIDDEVDYCISVGDYILSGGELASQVISDAIIRLIPGVISEGSLLEESFNNHLLEYNQYALPKEYNKRVIPDIYFTGNHTAIEDYRLKESLDLTKKRRPDLYSQHELTKEEKTVLDKCDEEWVKTVIDKAKKGKK